jgi:hypothetical protein
MARVHMLKEARLHPPGDWQLCFQWCLYALDDGPQHGYRFIWRRPDGDLQAARGQARIPSIAEAKALMDKAIAEGWGDRDGDAMTTAAEKLKAQGCVVDLASGYVGWPDKDTSIRRHLTTEMMGWERIVREWS